MTSFPATRCVECGMTYSYPVTACRSCHSKSLEEHRIDGHGTVYARTTIRVPDTDHLGEEPFEIALIDVGVEESVRVTGRVRENPELRPGDDVIFDERLDGELFFRATE